MEASRRRDSPSLPALADLENQLNRSESDMISNSFFTVESSKVRLHPIENSAKTAWTNEKHDMYLDHLESSFVKQLHRSVFKNHPRCAGKQRFVRATKMQDSSTALNLGGRDNNVFFNKAGLSTGQIFERHGKSLDYFEEFSDQNFPDEASEQMCVTTMSKRSKSIIS
ncbi:hypothetical protein L1987_55197 [Smallanthus sonchifolius]|uniref:Uncharacterized protein n=1 Tax=Smallanthus sonchifolius TaxID=185202 RepID=A0ACB9E955_9ASTR|nr:hypothetical protein L1987_55197 [Smallanthus sonchifolius]